MVLAVGVTVMAHRLITICVLISGISSVWAIRESRQITTMRRDQALLQARKVAMSLPARGAALPPLRVHDQAGRPLYITHRSDASEQLLLFVYSPYCPSCDATWPYWTQLANEWPSVRAVALSTTGPTTTPESYFDRHLVPNAIGKFALAPQSLIPLNTRATPQTVLIDATGRVSGAWLGAISAATATQIREAVVKGMGERP